MNNTNNETAVPCLKTVDSRKRVATEIVLDWKETCGGLVLDALYRTGCLSVNYNISFGISFGLDIDKGLDEGIDIWSAEAMVSDPAKDYSRNRDFHNKKSAQAWCLQHAGLVFAHSNNIKD